MRHYAASVGFHLELGPQACLDGAGAISGPGTFDFTGGNLPARLTIDKGALMLVTGPGTKDLSTFACGTAAGQIVDSGRVVVAEGTLGLGGTGTFQTARGGVLSIAPGATVTAGKLLSNAGTMDVAPRPAHVKPGTPATVSQVPLRNTGSIVASAGQTLVLDAVPVTNAGSVMAARGLVSVLSSYRQQRNGLLVITIDGRTPGTSLGQLTVSGAATLAGTLRILLARGFSPRRGEAFQFLQYQSRSGKFGALAGHPSYRVSYRRSGATVSYR
ncbi:MAG: hypothetical protein ACLQFR_07930 [Streptosporangiaceae bacterium]